MFCESGFIFCKMRLDIADIAFFCKGREQQMYGVPEVMAEPGSLAHMLPVAYGTGAPAFQGAGSALLILHVPR